MPLQTLTPETSQLPLDERRRRRAADRFIPSRSATDLDVSAFEVEAGGSAAHEQEVNASPAKEEYKKRLAAEVGAAPKIPLFRGVPANNRVLNFSRAQERAAGRSSSSDDTLRMLYTLNRQSVKRASYTSRPIPQSPERILDAPELLDDYYLNLLDWNAENILGDRLPSAQPRAQFCRSTHPVFRRTDTTVCGTLRTAVALGDSVYLWNASTGAITPLMQTSGSGCHVTSIAWAPRGQHQMAVGTSDHKVQIWDTAKQRMIRSMDGHCGRVGVLAWNNSMLSSGSRDASILHRDTRAPQQVLAKLHGHAQEVCGLKWAPNGSQLASGGNDNLLNVWDERRLSNSPPLYVLDHHKAAVKALAWCPWKRDVLASGGGTADRMIRFWNVATGSFINAVDTHSQVCALQWSQHDRELVSSHGFSHNQIILWKYPSMVKVAELTGHTSRVLHLAQSPDGTTVVSAAADETLRFWKSMPRDTVRTNARW